MCQKKLKKEQMSALYWGAKAILERKTYFRKHNKTAEYNKAFKITHLKINKSTIQHSLFFLLMLTFPLWCGFVVVVWSSKPAFCSDLLIFFSIAEKIHKLNHSSQCFYKSAGWRTAGKTLYLSRGLTTHLQTALSHN